MNLELVKNKKYLDRHKLKELRAEFSKNDLIEDYINYLLSIKGYSQHTLDSYQHDLVWLFRFLKLRRDQIDEEELKRYRNNGKLLIFMI